MAIPGMSIIIQLHTTNHFINFIIILFMKLNMLWSMVILK